jgi:hypothetical protein
VRVPRHNLIGTLNDDGWRVSTTTLANERGTNALPVLAELARNKRAGSQEPAAAPWLNPARGDHRGRHMSYALSANVALASRRRWLYG